MASLVPRPLPDLSHHPREKSILHGCRIKSGSGLGTILATNYANEEMKTFRHCLKTSLHNETQA